MDAAVDNDLILKAVSYGLTETFWPATNPEIGILGAARYVVGHEIDRSSLARGAAAAKSDLGGLLSRCEELEPTAEEVALAAEIELCGQEHGLALDNGESQLAAIVVTRDIAHLETGDKRAIAGLEQARCHLPALHCLQRRVRCLEQIAYRAAAIEEAFEVISDTVCAEVGVDRSLSICFGCFGDVPADQATTLEALGQYIREIRSTAAAILADEG